MDKVIGILGGMGPEATLDCFGKIIKNTPTKTVGLLGTVATVQSGLFQKRLAREKIHTLAPDSTQQSQIVAAIKDIKDTRPSRTQSEITTDLIKAARSLIDKKAEGADAIIAGCTEIPLALGQEHLPVPYFDSLTILARAAIRFAGKVPIE